MVEYINTLKGSWRKRVNVRALPPHPIEKDPAFAEYLEFVGSPDTTRYGLERILRATSPCTLGQLTPQAINHALDKLVADGYKPTSVDRYRRILKAFLKFCQDNAFVQRNVVSKSKEVDMRQVKKPRPARVADKVRDTLDAYYQNPDKATIGEMFLWATIKSGHRISEAAMAVAGDILLEPLPGGGFKPMCYLGTKTEKRLVKYPQWMTPVFLALLEVAQGDAQYPLIHLNGIPVVFVPKQKTTIRHRTLLARRMFYDVQTALFGKPVANPHAFRSDYISRVMSQHPDFLTLETVAAHCGHSPDNLRTFYADLLGIGPANIEEV